jgi:hypothetical protein
MFTTPTTETFKQDPHTRVSPKTEAAEDTRLKDLTEMDEPHIAKFNTDKEPPALA